VKIETTIKIKKATAHYTLAPAGPGMYYADLQKFSGKPENAPPSRILLVRNVRQWSGSIENTALLNQLGQVIDTMAEKAPIFKEVSPRRRAKQNNTSPEQ